MKSYLSPQLEARSLPAKGHYGVFAQEDVAQGTLLAVWTGDVVDEEALEQVPVEIRPYVAQIEETLYLVSRPPIEPADYINHSCDPNAGMSGQIGIVALRDIRAGEEVCIDYAMCDGSPYDEFECSCGVPRCRGHVTGMDWMQAELHERYAGYFSPYLQRRIDRLRETMGVEDEPMEFTIHAITYDSDLMQVADEITAQVWPQFMLNDQVANRHWYDLYRKFPDYQFALLSRKTGK
ncbi:MAG: SET domain-containing protein, partial [Anaerolineae bacterium]